MTWLKKLICDFFHGGGTIRRDWYGRINWQCDKCGRWSDHPVPRDEERRFIDATIEDYKNQ